MSPYATDDDHRECRRLHRAHGTTYYFASRRFNAVTRRRVDALYAFVRVPDEWVDNPGALSPSEREGKLLAYERELALGLEGVRPSHPALRAFCDAMRETGLGLEEPREFLASMRADLAIDRYETYADLQGYMRGSAVSVALMMCRLVGAPDDDGTRESAIALGEAMQMTNFLRDVGEDVRRGRIYLPMEDLRRFGVSENQIEEGRVDSAFRDLMRFEIDRARELYARADVGIPRLPDPMRLPIRIARTLYARILDRIEARGYNVFGARARTTVLEKAVVAVALARSRTGVG